MNNQKKGPSSYKSWVDGLKVGDLHYKSKIYMPYLIRKCHFIAVYRLLLYTLPICSHNIGIHAKGDGFQTFPHVVLGNTLFHAPP
jgi:hypothetical protein